MTNFRSCLRPRFSLRLLLLGVTAFGVGFPVWYRMPYEERTDTSTIPGQPTSMIWETRITTWRREWGGTRVKHGKERVLWLGRPLKTVIYQNGEPHETISHVGHAAPPDAPARP